MSTDMQIKKDFQNRHISNDKIRKIINGLSDNGYYLIEGYYSNELCNNIKLEIDKIIADPKNKFLVTNKESNDFRQYGADRISKLIREYKQDNFLLNLCETYLGYKSKAYFTLSNKVIANSKVKFGSGGGWHRDNTTVKQFKSMIYLNDVDNNNGPFQIVSGTHKKSSLIDSIIFSDIKSNQDRINNESLKKLLSKKYNYKIKTITGSKGSLLIFNSFAIHRGSKLNNNERYAITNYYFPNFYINEYKELLDKKFNLPGVD
tara:strand:- start:11710 stop:12492 length:783 start_codon:yes stop_codon:yes gene_type:complete